MNDLATAMAICIGITVVICIVIHWINNGVRNYTLQIVLSGLICFVLMNIAAWASTPFFVEYLSQQCEDKNVGNR